MNITFDSFDKLGRKQLAERLTRVISTFYPFTKEAYVLSLNASFGSGKTTFLSMWKSSLEAEGYNVIYLDAWESDFDDEPLIPIISTLMGAIRPTTIGEKTKAALRGALGATALASNGALNKLTGVDVHKIMTTVEEDLKDTDLVAQGKKIHKEFSYKQKAYATLRESLSEYVASLDKKPLIILVDELDRVRPDYAVKFLEAIKHIFSIQGICFVLAVDKAQLKNSIEQLYGNIDFNGYYRRFVTRDFNLPQVNRIPNLREFINEQAIDYFDQKNNNGITFVFSDKQKNTILSYMVRICRAFEMSPREIQLLFRIYCQFMAIAANNRQFMDTWMTAPLVLIALLIKKEEMYETLGKGTLSPKKAIAYIDTLYFSGHRADEDKRDLTFDILAFSLTDNNVEFKKEAAEILKARYSYGASNDSVLDSLARMTDRFGIFPSTESAFQNFYEKIENWRDFLDEKETA